MNVSPVGPSTVANPITGVAAQPQGGRGFAGALADQLQSANDKQIQADRAIEQLATGEADNVHDVVLSMAEADLSFRLILEVRNRLIESYQEIMRMQV